MEYCAYIIKSSDLVDSDSDYHGIEVSSYLPLPNISLGFQHFLHAKKENIKEFEQFGGRKQIQNITHKFNFITDNPKTIQTLSTSFFGVAVTQEFCELWETIITFGLINKKMESFLHINDTNESHQMASKLYVKKYLGGKSKHTNEPINNSFDFVSISLPGTHEYRNLREQDSLVSFCHSLVTALMSVKENGVVVCTVFETFTSIMNKVIQCMLRHFNDLIITKPVIRNPMDDERTIVFRKRNKVKDFKLITDIVSSSVTNRNKYVVDAKNSLSEAYITMIRKANIDTLNRQFMAVNNGIDFVNQENYYGDKYKALKETQLESTILWKDTFLRININTDIQDTINELMTKNIKEANKLAKDLAAN